MTAYRKTPPSARGPRAQVEAGELLVRRARAAGKRDGLYPGGQLDMARASAAIARDVERDYGLRAHERARVIPAAIDAYEKAFLAARPKKNGREKRRGRRNGDTDVGNIIAQQLGGVGRLRVMLNAKNIYAIENGLQFGFAGRRETGNKVVIKLEPSDTYRVEFWWVRGAKAALVKAFDDIYAEQLMDIFEKQTGLYLTMHPRRNSRRRRTSRKKKKRTSRGRR